MTRVVMVLLATFFSSFAQADVWFCTADAVILSEFNTETYTWHHDTTEDIDDFLLIQTTTSDGAWKLMYIGEKELTSSGVCDWESRDSSKKSGFVRCRIGSESEHTQLMLVLDTETQRFVYFDPTGYLEKATDLFGESFAVAMGTCTMATAD